MLRRTWQLLTKEGVVALLYSGTRFLHTVIRRAFYRGAAKLRHWRYVSQYGDSTADPYELICIDPEDVEYRVYPYFEEGLSEYGTYIIGGNWDKGHPDYTLGYTLDEHRLIVPLEESMFFDSIEKWMAGECKWKETEFYRRDIINKSELFAEERLEKLDALRSDITTGDYRSQRELRQHGEDGKSPQQRVMLPPEHSEVEVAIGRGGEIFFNDGKHRFSIARYAGVDTIPVRVIVRHTEWQKIREEVFLTETAADLSPKARSHLPHPDLQTPVNS